MNSEKSSGAGAGSTSSTFTPGQYREMLAAVCESQALFLEEPGRSAFDRLLDAALQLTDSEYGFIGEIAHDQDGKPVLKERAILFRSWNDELRQYFSSDYEHGFDFGNLDSLLGKATSSSQPLIVNDAAGNVRAARKPTGQPVVTTFLSLPLSQWDEVVGLIGLANSPNGYGEALFKELEPISMSCASLIIASRNYSARQQMETALFESEKRHRLLFENSRDALMTFTQPTFLFAAANKAALALFAADNREQLARLTPWDVSPQYQPDGRTSLNRWQELTALAMRKGSHAFEWEFRRLGGRVFSADVLLARIEAGATPLLQATVRDTTAQAQARIALQRASQNSEILLRASSDGVHILDPNGNLVQMSDSFCRMLGYTRSDMQGMHVSQWDAKWSDVELRERIHELLKKAATFETTHRRKDGSLLEVEVNTKAISLDGATMLYCSSRDITERKLSEQNIVRQATIDPLTQLPNRNLFRDRLEQEVRKSHRSGWPMALMLIDLDRFKEVNDTLGHDMGDSLLIEAGRRIISCVRESDTVARLGGDEFTVILSELDDTKSVDRVVEKIIRRLASPFRLGDDQAFVSASVGITMYPDDATDIEALLKNADQAMYLAKSQGRNRFCFFTAELQEAAQHRMRLSNDLRNALAAGDQFQVYYQPIVEMVTGKIRKAEALIRWHHPTRGLVNPSEFIALAEETGMIVEIGDWIFREAMRQCKKWRAHDPEFQISVNCSPVQFHHDENLAKSWIAHLHKNRLPGQSLVIEITEGLLLNLEGPIRDQLLSFRDAGVQVSIDDFGTGYSSLSYLNKLDIDYLKIDQSFVRNLEYSANDMALCEAIVIMSSKLGLKTVAEGVSTEGQRNLLMRAGCDYVQGFLFSRPVPAEEFEPLLKR